MLNRRHQGTLAVTLVASLLLCHGFAGPAHPDHAAAEDAATGPAHASAHAPAHSHGLAGDLNLPGHPGGEPAGGLLDCYAYVLLAVALGIAARWGPAWRRLPDTLMAHAHLRRYPLSDGLRRSRAPDSAVLGVFLL